ncbi:MAG: hypothetical protein R2749_03890 [Acidimicrobiales bacterium]
MQVSTTVGVIIGADHPIGAVVARALLVDGAASVTLLDRRRALTGLQARADGLVAQHRDRSVRAHGLDLDDPVALAQRFASIRHDEGPVDWVVNLLGPAAGPQPDALHIDGVAVGEPPRWPELSLAASATRVTASFGRSVLVTRLAREEFRHRGGVLVHGWCADGDGPDALWRACEAAVRTLAAADAEAAGTVGADLAVSVVDAGDGVPLAAAVQAGLRSARRGSPAGNTTD